MSVAKKVLLARPHFFIVAEMRPFLEKAGFAPSKLETLADLGGETHGFLSGAVISTAVVSSVGASVEEVFSAVRAKYPRLPILFAGLLDFPTMKSAVERYVKSHHADAEILPIAAQTESHPGLGKKSVFLVLTKENLASEEARALAQRVLRKHFG